MEVAVIEKISNVARVKADYAKNIPWVRIK